MEGRTESDGQKRHSTKKGPRKQLWGNDVQPIRQRSEGKSDGGGEELPDLSAPVVSVKMLIDLMLLSTLSIKKMEQFQKDSYSHEVHHFHEVAVTFDLH